MKKLLLINPWIYDFTAFDLWSKPLGLLYIASMLEKFGYEVRFIDCLDRHASVEKSKSRKYGIGKYRRTKVPKPDILSHIPRNFARYGIDENYFIELLEKYRDSDAVLITSIMTYWYLGVKRVSELVRKILPNAPIILGGIYATLLPEHAKKVIKPDYIITGPGEIKILELLSQIFDIPLDRTKLPQTLDDYPFPDFDLINHPDYLVILTSRGCLFDCSFCAQRLISMPFAQRSVENVIAEFEYRFDKFHIKDFAFYDDALFLNKETHIEKILMKLIEKGLNLRLHTPNGLFAREIDKKLAELMHSAGFETIRLSFETSNESRRIDMSSKISNSDLVRAIENLVDAGYSPNEIDVYVMMGLPNQSFDEVRESMMFVHSLGAKIRLASFSPIHGTREFQKAVRMSYIPENIDPLLTNKSIYPLAKNSAEIEQFQLLRTMAKKLNDTAYV
ncbi:radical SAM protein [bacterium]|nr:radical SAM protein [bacterium]